MMREEISRSDVEAAYRLHQQGLPWETISKALGVSRSAIHERVRMAYSVESQAEATAAWGKIRDAYLAGESVERLHEISGCSRHAIRVALRLASPAERTQRHEITRRRGNDFPMADIYAAVSACAKDIGETPSTKQYQHWRAADPERVETLPSVATIAHRAETWRDACSGAGLAPKSRFDGAGAPRYWTSERVEARLREYAAESGGLPSVNQYVAISAGRKDLPSIRTVVIRVGNWGRVRYAINHGLPIEDVPSS